MGHVQELRGNCPGRRRNCTEAAHGPRCRNCMEVARDTAWNELWPKGLRAGTAWELLWPRPPPRPSPRCPT
eukprot:14887482-Alexandrium_andersonii.AAC.1